MKRRVLMKSLFLHFSRTEKGFFVAGLYFQAKRGFRVTTLKRIFAILFYTGTLAVKHAPPSSRPNSDLIYNFLSELHFLMIYIFISLRKKIRKGKFNSIDLNKEKVQNKFLF